jgi:hypothetical protein
VSRLIVARDNLAIRANSVEADGLLANGDVEIASPHTRVTRVAGFGYEFVPGPTAARLGAAGVQLPPL